MTIFCLYMHAIAGFHVLFAISYYQLYLQVGFSTWGSGFQVRSEPKSWEGCKMAGRWSCSYASQLGFGGKP